MEEEAKKAERDLEKKLEILKKYNKKETKSVKKIFIVLFSIYSFIIIPFCFVINTSLEVRTHFHIKKTP